MTTAVTNTATRRPSPSSSHRCLRLRRPRRPRRWPRRRTLLVRCGGDGFMPAVGWVAVVVLFVIVVVGSVDLDLPSVSASTSSRSTGCLRTCCRNCRPVKSSHGAWPTAGAGAVPALADSSASNGVASSVVALTMEGIGNNVPVGSFYRNALYGVTFDPDALALVDADVQGGSGNFAYEPSPSTTLQFYRNDTIVMNAMNGIPTGMSFYYSSITRNGSVTVWDGPNGTGTLLASQPFYPLGFFRGDGDPSGDFNRWRGVGLTWNRKAQSVVFKGSVNRMLMDDITLGSATSKCPDNATLSTFELWNGATDSRTTMLKEGGSYCLRGNWNVRVKTVHEMAVCGPVLIKFFTGRTALKRKLEDQPFYFLFGDDPVTRNVYGNMNVSPKVSSLALTNGTKYCVRSTEGNRTGYSQVCFVHVC